jgi:Ca-activated chloride channel family protein
MVVRPISRRARLGATALVVVIAAIVSLASRIQYFPSNARDWWHTADQRGHQAYTAGQFAEASDLFRALAWRATACYRASDYHCAADSFAQLPGATAAFNLGNSLAHLGKIEPAIAAYDATLAMAPDLSAARKNRQLLQRALDEAARAVQRPEGDGEAQLAPDGFDVKKGKGGKAGEVRIEQLDAKAIDKLWLRNVSTDPANFLRLRFAAEQQSRRDTR